MATTIHFPTTTTATIGIGTYVVEGIARNGGAPLIHSIRYAGRKITQAEVAQQEGVTVAKVRTIAAMAIALASRTVVA